MKKEKLYCRFVWFHGEIVAAFMYTSAGRRISPRDRGQLLRGCYAHVGQHGECYDGMIRNKRVTPAEYADLKKELETIGYKVIVS